jgi:hypothetical protein
MRSKINFQGWPAMKTGKDVAVYGMLISIFQEDDHEKTHLPMGCIAVFRGQSLWYSCPGRGCHPLSGPNNISENVVFDECMGKPFLSLLDDLARSHGMDTLQDDRFPQSTGCPLRAFINGFEGIKSPILIDAEHNQARIIQLPETDTYAPSYGAIVKSPSDELVKRGWSSRLPVKRQTDNRNTVRGDTR